MIEIHRDTLYTLHATCGAQYRGSIVVLECNGHSLEEEWEGLVVMCDALLISVSELQASGPRAR